MDAHCRLLSWPLRGLRLSLWTGRPGCSLYGESMYFLFTGPPGAGKGTQAELLSLYTGLPLVSGGDLLRAAASGNGIFAAKIKRRLDNGEIITEPFVMDLIEHRLSRQDCGRGAILDGCVRTKDQAIALDRITRSRGGITAVILLDLPDNVATARLAIRQTTSPPDRQEACVDVSRLAAPRSQEGATPYRRPDDHAQIIPKRQFLYKQVTGQAIEHYRNHARLIELDGTQPIAKIHQCILRALCTRPGLFS